MVEAIPKWIKVRPCTDVNEFKERLLEIIHLLQVKKALL